MTHNKQISRAVCGAMVAVSVDALLTAQAVVIVGSGNIILPLLIGTISMAAAFAIWDD
jgi:hypothetical protein